MIANISEKCRLESGLKEHYSRKGSEEKRHRPRQKTPKPSPDYYDDYYYDSAPWPQKRQGYGEDSCKIWVNCCVWTKDYDTYKICIYICTNCTLTEVQYHLGLDFTNSGSNYLSGLEWSCTRWSTTDSDRVHQRGSSRVGLHFTCPHYELTFNRWTWLLKSLIKLMWRLGNVLKEDLIFNGCSVRLHLL